MHWSTIAINGETVIGKNFNIAQGILIGYSDGKNKGVLYIGDSSAASDVYKRQILIGYSDGKNKGVLYIGDNVIINANVVVGGGVKIGNNVLIAPNAFVNFDVSDNSIVIGNPGKIIRRESSPTGKYMVYKLKE